MNSGTPFITARRRLWVALAACLALPATQALSQDADREPPGPNAPPSDVGQDLIQAETAEDNAVVGRIVDISDRRLVLELNKPGENDTVAFSVPIAAEIILNKEQVELTDLQPADFVRITPSRLDATVAQKVVAARVVVENPPREGGRTATGADTSERRGPMGDEDAAGMGLVVSPVQGIALPNQLGLRRGQGALVVDLIADGPAALAGILPGDVLISINRQPIASPRALLRSIERREPGSTVTVGLWRAGDPTTGAAAQAGTVQTRGTVATGGTNAEGTTEGAVGAQVSATQQQSGAAVQAGQAVPIAENGTAEVTVTLASQAEAPDSLAPEGQRDAAASGVGSGTTVAPGTTGVTTPGLVAPGIVGPGFVGPGIGVDGTLPQGEASLENIQQLLIVLTQEVRALRQELQGMNQGAGNQVVNPRGNTPTVPGTNPAVRGTGPGARTNDGTAPGIPGTGPDGPAEDGTVPGVPGTGPEGSPAAR